jgi:hypothetical protein
MENAEVFNERAKKLESFRFSPDGPILIAQPQVVRIEIKSHTKLAGRIVAMEPNLGSGWNDTSSVWYAYVQRVRKDIKKRGESRKVVDVLWLYHPEATTCGNSYYQLRNELF